MYIHETTRPFHADAEMRTRERERERICQRTAKWYALVCNSPQKSHSIASRLVLLTSPKAIHGNPLALCPRAPEFAVFNHPPALGLENSRVLALLLWAKPSLPLPLPLSDVCHVYQMIRYKFHKVLPRRAAHTPTRERERGIFDHVSIKRNN